MLIELNKLGLSCYKQKPINVHYQGKQVGKYYADIIVEDTVIIELKASTLIEEHEFQLLNYLKATDIEVGLLLGFGKNASFKRKIFTNEFKNQR